MAYFAKVVISVNSKNRNREFHIEKDFAEYRLWEVRHNIINQYIKGKKDIESIEVSDAELVINYKESRQGYRSSVIVYFFRDTCCPFHIRIEKFPKFKELEKAG